MGGKSLKVIPTKASMIVSNPLSQSTVVNWVVKDCSLGFGKYVFLANLILLSFHELDAILGLDWLTRNKVVVECKSKGVWLLSANGNNAFISWVKRGVENSIVSAISSRKMIAKGGDSYLAYILDSIMVREDFRQVPVVNEFPNVLLEELRRTPPNRYVEFSIDIASGIAPIFKYIL